MNNEENRSTNKTQDAQMPTMLDIASASQNGESANITKTTANGNLNNLIDEASTTAIPVGDMLCAHKNGAAGYMSRLSGIELLKIISIFLIVLSHVVQTLTSYTSDIPFNDYVINVDLSSPDPTHIILALLRYCGQLGNSIFLICSIWFMLDKDKSSKQKILRIIADIWVMSVCILVPVLIARHGDVNSGFILSSFFPTLCSNNWYMTCYILLSFIYPLLNKLIKAMSQRELLGAALFLGAIYIVINFFQPSFYVSAIIIWISVYFIFAYIKIYGKNLCEKPKFGAVLLLTGIICNTLTVVATNFIGLKVSSLSTKVLYGLSASNPFFYIIAFGAFCLFYNAKFHSKFINGFSSLSMLIYILHENLLLRAYYRTMLWHEIYIRFGHEYVLAWVFAISVAIFVASALLCFVYSKTIQKLTHIVSDKLYVALQKFYQLIEKKVFKID